MLKKWDFSEIGVLSIQEKTFLDIVGQVEMNKVFLNFGLKF